MLYDPKWNAAESPLKTLSRALRDRSQWPADFSWDFQRTDCCAIGLAARIGLGRPHDDLPGPVKDRIFINADSKRVPVLSFFSRKARYSDVTPEMVADQIDEYLAERA